MDLTFSKLYVYNLDDDVLDSLKLMYFDSGTYEQKTEDEYIKHKKASESDYVQQTQQFAIAPIIKPKPRNVPKPQESDYDKYNKRRQANKLEPLTEEEFEARMDQLSISDDDDEEEEEGETLPDIPEASDGAQTTSISFIYTRSPCILFNSSLLPHDKCFSVYKTTLDVSGFDSEPFKTIKAFNTLQMKETLSQRMSALFMIGGGHFAGAIISHKPIATKGNKGTPEELRLQSVNFVVHKTFHRYTTRRKQGGSQSASDNARGKANSAGSSLRRYNEQALQQEVEQLLQSWKPYLDKCEKIFIKANGAYSHKSLVSKNTGAAISVGDKRIRLFPFTTKRPTTMELRRAWCELSYLKVVDVPEDNRAAFEREMKRNEFLEKSKQQSKQPPQNSPRKISEQERITNELIALLRKSKAPALISYVRTNKVNVNMSLEPVSEYCRHTPTLLHYASKNGLHRMCQVLLTSLKADPTIENVVGRTAYQIASDSTTKCAFEIARYNLGEDYCKWEEDAKVPEARSREEVDKLISEEKEKEKEETKKVHEEELESARKGIKERHDKKFGKGRTIGLVNEQTKLEALSPEQRMRVMREQRARAAEARLRKNP
ncbi:hypothetical protein FOA43_001839 [Brettanomyces nanus]|uniref:VLRF1 domain-containing protein n=1 Tax=Eeniella nana TaxID=13502 RepID=A0A875S409_EENNA|nr:uncharacterized protein FOA43_001839 [Brettanomyces nanus]QPG74509.1 hypothetical protein FOA43_001839 [Brettanomyces nanus]